MQKTVMVFASLLTLNFASIAQFKHEVSMGYGFGTTNEASDSYTDDFATIFTLGYYTQDVKYSGSLHVSYKNFVTNKLAIGGTLAYQSAKGDYFFYGEKAGTIHRNYYSIGAEADYRYIKKEKFHLYSGLGLGYTFYDEIDKPESGSETKNNSGNFDLQIIGIGARFGSNIGGFAELGFGYKGMICAGFFFRM